MYKCQYCDSTKVKGRVPLKAVANNNRRSDVIIMDASSNALVENYTNILCDVCEDCGHILRFYFDKPSPDFKVDGIDYNK